MTIKLRVVFYASVGTTTVKSLNNIQMVGLVVQTHIYSILLRFGEVKFIITGDIEKMYRKVLVKPSQRCLQHFFIYLDLQNLSNLTQLTRLPMVQLQYHT